MWIQKIDWQQWLLRWTTFSTMTSLYLLCEDDLGIELGSHGCRLCFGSPLGKWCFLHLFLINTRSVSWQCLQLVFLLENRSLRQRKDVKEPNPTLHVSKSTRLGQSHHAASNWSTVYWAKQLIYAWQGRPPGGIWHCIPCRWMKSQL